MLRLLALFIGIAYAQATSPSYLIYSTMPLCQTRSVAQCAALGCDGVNTVYWWDCSTGPLKSGLVGPNAVTSGSYAMMIQTSPSVFSAVHPIRGIGLTTSEINKLVSATAISPVLPNAVP